MIEPDELTLTDVESAVGYTVQESVAEYKAGDYGNPDDWTAERAAYAELEGDAGDRIRAAFKGRSADRAAELWTEGIKAVWEPA